MIRAAAFAALLLWPVAAWASGNGTLPAPAAETPAAAAPTAVTPPPAGAAPAPAETSPAETQPAEAQPPESQPAEAAVPAGSSGPAAQPEPPLDVATLEDKLRDTDAIGFFTKIELKSQVDRLIDRFRSYHANGRPPLDTLHEAFNLLLLKVLTLLQDDAPKLHAEIVQAREQLWSLLVDPKEFAKL